MSDDNEDDGSNANDEAMKHVVKKGVSDLFGEEEKPKPSFTTVRYEYPSQYGGIRSNSWKDDNPGFAFQRAGKAEKESLTTAAWGKPRDKAMRSEYDDVGNPTGVHFNTDQWKMLRGRIFRTLLRELDWERVVLMPDDNVLLEQTLDTIMRRSRFQAGKEGSSYSYGTLVQVPITVGDGPPPEPAVLPASSIDLKDDGWGRPDDDEVIDVSNPGSEK